MTLRHIFSTERASSGTPDELLGRARRSDLVLWLMRSYTGGLTPCHDGWKFPAELLGQLLQAKLVVPALLHGSGSSTVCELWLLKASESGKLLTIFRSLVKRGAPLHRWSQKGRGGRAVWVTPYGWEWEGKRPCCISYRMSVTACRSAVRQTAENCVLHWRVTARRQSHTAAVTATRLLGFQLMGSWLV